MTLQEFAKMVDGKEYGFQQFTAEEIQAAKDNGFVIVFGASDDLMEFDGAIQDEAGCYDGGKVYFDREGVASGSSDIKPNMVEAVWCGDDAKDENGDTITWTYKTDIPHETFMIYDGEEPYCRGIVFSMDDVA